MPPFFAILAALATFTSLGLNTIVRADNTPACADDKPINYYLPFDFGTLDDTYPTDPESPCVTVLGICSTNRTMRGSGPRCMNNVTYFMPGARQGDTPALWTAARYNFTRQATTKPLVCSDANDPFIAGHWEYSKVSLQMAGYDYDRRFQIDPDWYVEAGRPKTRDASGLDLLGSGPHNASDYITQYLNPYALGFEDCSWASWNMMGQRHPPALDGCWNNVVDTPLIW